MNLIKLLAVILFTATTALAQGGLPIRNDTPTTLRDLGSNLNVGRNYAVDQYGRILLGSSAAAGIYSEDSAHTSGDKGQAVFGIVNSNAATLAAGEQDYVNFGLSNKGAIFPDLNTDFRQSTLRSPMKPEDEAVADTSALMMMGGVNLRNFAAFNSTSLDATPIGVGDKGVLAAMLMYDSSLGGASSAIVLEDASGADAQALVAIAGLRSLTPTAFAGDIDFTYPALNDVSAWYVDGVRRGTFVHSNPSVANATSVTLLAANTARRYVLIQNNSAANICISLNNATLTGIVPSSTNPCIVLAAGASYISPPNAAPTAAITVYQTSGGAITSITTVEQS